MLSPPSILVESQLHWAIQLLKTRHNNPLMWLGEEHGADLKVHLWVSQKPSYKTPQNMLWFSCSEQERSVSQDWLKERATPPALFNDCLQHLLLPAAASGLSPPLFGRAEVAIIRAILQDDVCILQAFSFTIPLCCMALCPKNAHCLWWETKQTHVNEAPPSLTQAQLTSGVILLLNTCF